MTIPESNFVNYVCVETKACRSVDPMELRKPRFFLDGVQQDPSRMQMGYDPIQFPQTEDYYDKLPPEYRKPGYVPPKRNPEDM
jgi:hypothetical protein